MNNSTYLPSPYETSTQLHIIHHDDDIDTSIPTIPVPSRLDRDVTSLRVPVRDYEGNKENVSPIYGFAPYAQNRIGHELQQSIAHQRSIAFLRLSVVREGNSSIIELFPSRRVGSIFHRISMVDFSIISQNLAILLDLIRAPCPATDADVSSWDTSLLHAPLSTSSNSWLSSLTPWMCFVLALVRPVLITILVRTPQKTSLDITSKQAAGPNTAPPRVPIGPPLPFPLNLLTIFPSIVQRKVPHDTTLSMFERIASY